MAWAFIVIMFVLLEYCAFGVRCAAVMPICVQGQSCSLPNCRCRESGVPGQLRTDRIPQMILISVDGSLAESEYQQVKFLLQDEINPNGCPSSMTYFVSLENTALERVWDLYQQGTEIGLLGNFENAFTKQEAGANIRKSLNALERETGIPRWSIRGWRDTAHVPLGEIEMNILREHGFEYDSSLLVDLWQHQSTSRLGTYPFTLDFGWGSLCTDPFCRSATQNGFWEIPVPVAQDNTFCAISGACTTSTPSMADAFQSVLQTFRRHYFIDRSPMVLHLQASWLFKPAVLKILKDFMYTTLRLGDVYFLSLHQALQWTKHPTPLSEISMFEPWNYTCALATGDLDLQQASQNGQIQMAFIMDKKLEANYTKHREGTFISQEAKPITMDTVNGAIEKIIMTRREQILRLYKTERITVSQKNLIFVVIAAVSGLFIFTACVVFFCRDNEDRRNLRNKATHNAIYEFA